MRARLISLLCLLALALGGCTSPTPTNKAPDLPPLNPQEVPTQLPHVTSLPETPIQGDATPMLQPTCKK
jgi:PBP1b-binding outer membrane lipoprotein LpoB